MTIMEHNEQQIILFTSGIVKIQRNSPDEATWYQFQIHSICDSTKKLDHFVNKRLSSITYQMIKLFGSVADKFC